MRVRCGDRKWDVHKAILCARSGWFRSWINSDQVKAIKECIPMLRLSRFEEYEIDCLLQYIYTGSINVTSTYPAIGSLASVSIWSLGDHFQIPDLCKLALDGFK